MQLLVIPLSVIHVNISYLSPAVCIQDKLWNFLLKAEGRKLCTLTN